MSKVLFELQTRQKAAWTEDERECLSLLISTHPNPARNPWEIVKRGGPPETHVTYLAKRLYERPYRIKSTTFEDLVAQLENDYAGI